MSTLKQRLLLLTAAICALGVATAAPQTSKKIPKKIPAKYDAAYFKKLQSNTLTSDQSVVWKNFGPAMSGYCDEFWIHPTNPDFMYTTLDMGNGYYTEDNGNKWITIHDWDATGEGGRIGWIDFSRQDPTFGLAIDEKGHLMRTTNQGRRFERIHSEGYPERSGAGKKSVVAVDPTDDNNWYIGAGQIWRVKFTRFTLKTPNGTKFRNTDYGYILVSKDRGESWREVRVGFDDLDVLRIFVNPANNKHVYAFTNNGFYKSTNEGESFERCGKGLPYNISRDGAMHYDKKSGKVTLFFLEQTNFYEQADGSITSKGGVFRSDDLGETWSSITGDLAVDYSQIESNFHINSQFQKTMASWFGVPFKDVRNKYRRVKWELLSSYNRLIVNPLNVNEICVSNNIKHDVSFGPVEMWKSDDGGKHWYPTMRNGKYWATELDRDFWLSRGDGKDALGRNMKFAHLEREMAEDFGWVGARYAEFNARGEMLAVMEQQVFRSVDGGKSFQQIDDIESTPGSWVGRGCSNLPGEGLEHETGTRYPMLRSGEHGLWSVGDMGECKYDGIPAKQLSGQSKSSRDARSICAVAVDPTDTMKIYTLQFRQWHRGFLRASKDGGETWYSVNPDKTVIDYNIPPDAHCHQRDLRIDPNNPQRMYFTLPKFIYSNHNTTNWSSNLPKGLSPDKCGVWRTDDGGVTWSLSNNGIPASCSIMRLEIDPFNSNTIYASGSGHLKDAKSASQRIAVDGGVYKSTNGGDSWSKMNIPAEIECVNHLFVDRNTAEIYLSAGQSCGQPAAGGVWTSRDGGKTWKKIFNMPYIKECFPSNVDPNLIVVNVGQCKKIKTINPGAYVSQDGGSSWRKINYMLGQPCRINALRPDQYDSSIIWCALYGSGWYRAILKK